MVRNLLSLVLLIALGPIAETSFAGTNYKIGIGDVLDIRVHEEKEFTGNFRVGSDGEIDYPYIRRIGVKGKTTEELTLHLSTLLKQGYLADPQVVVEVKEFNSQKVLILGAITKPGTYSLEDSTKLLDLISRAGGVTPVGGKRILLLREKKKTENQTPEVKLAEDKQEPVVIDYYQMIHKGDFSQNIILEDGDLINIPKANEIFVLGNVARPGPVKYEDGMTILQAVTLAGGPTPTASTKSTYVLRQSEKGESKVNVRLDKILENKEKNFPLNGDDVIVVPESFF